MSWRFFYRFFLTRFISVNFSKGTPSVSVGPRGAKVTVGRRGAQFTAGLPGTGLSTTHRLRLRGLFTRRATPDAWKQAFIDHLTACVNNRNITVAEMRAALEYQHTLGLTDDDLGPHVLQAVEQVRVMILQAEAHGSDRIYGPTTQT